MDAVIADSTALEQRARAVLASAAAPDARLAAQQFVAQVDRRRSVALSTTRRNTSAQRRIAVSLAAVRQAGARLPRLHVAGDHGSCTCAQGSCAIKIETAEGKRLRRIPTYSSPPDAEDR